MKIIIWWLPTSLYAALIISMAFSPAPSLPSPHFDKLVHFFAYGLLAFFCYNSLCASGSSRPGMYAVAIVIVIGSLDESLQALGRVRTASVYDLLADAMGACFGVFITKRLSGFFDEKI